MKYDKKEIRKAIESVIGEEIAACDFITKRRVKEIIDEMELKISPDDVIEFDDKNIYYPSGEEIYEHLEQIDYEKNNE